MLCKLIVCRKRYLALLGTALAAAGILAAASWTPAAVSAAAARELPIYCVERDQKLCSISFDAAWGADNTQKILDVLDEYGVKATFFVVSAWAEQYPDTAKAIVAHGHELMNHSTKHDHYNSLTAEQIVADVNKCNDVIESLSGVRPTLIRCPYGEYDDHVIAAIRSIGMEPVQWDVERYHIKESPLVERVRGIITFAGSEGIGAAGCGKVNTPKRVSYSIFNVGSATPCNRPDCPDPDQSGLPVPA